LSRPPITKPRITGNQGFTLTALDQISISRLFERALEISPAMQLVRPDLALTRFGGFDIGDRVPFSREHEHRRFLGK